MSSSGQDAHVPARVAGLALFFAAAMLHLVANRAEQQRILKVKQNLTATKQKLGIVPGEPSEHHSKTAPLDSEALSHVSKGRVMQGAGINEIRIHDIDKLQTYNDTACRPNACWHGEGGEDGTTDCAVGDSHRYNKIIADEEYIVYNITRTPGKMGSSEAFIRAGPRANTHFVSEQVNAAIVCSGGLCPGLNNVIREIVNTLHFQYAVNRVWGIKGGFHGFKHSTDSREARLGSKSTDEDGFVLLTPAVVQDIQHQGGTVLSSSRGGFDADTIIDYLVKYNISQLYILGGDGTHRAANALCEVCLARKLNIAIAGIPKTIDNDVDLIDRSFGFQTSVEAAQAAIQSAKTEARCNFPNGIGIVALMGRSSGLIAAHATLSSGDVDLCLIPEVDTPLTGDNSALAFLLRRVKKKGHGVIVVAEGFAERVFGQNAECDAGGNRKITAVGPYLKDLVTTYFKEHGEEASVKFIDPSYMIRAVAANAADALYCILLGQNAVHGAMAGFTNFSTGLINNRVCYIPIPRIVATSPRGVDPRGRTWERVISVTRQPQVAVPRERGASAAALAAATSGTSADSAEAGAKVVA